MIPQIIHYCWFGHNPKPKLAEKCIKSWKRYCPDYEIIEWNEDNFDISACPLYVRQAYEAKKWAFVTDYVRLQVVYEHGGIYMDTDVELKKSLDPLLDHQAYFGFEDGVYINTGLGFGAVKGMPLLREMMDDYQDIPFVLPDGSFDTTTCPERNTEVLLRHGLRQDNTKQVIDGFAIYPKDVFCPLDYYTGKVAKTKNTVAIHWFSASWQTKEAKQRHKRNKRKTNRTNRLHFILHIPHRVLRLILGEKNYEKLKHCLK